MKSTVQLLEKPLDAQQRTQLLHGWNPDPTEYPETTVEGLFEKQAAERSEAVALVFKEQRLSYGELNAQANRLAHHLIKLGVQPGQTVALYLERGPAQLIAMLATLKAGAAYLPLDVEFPSERIAQMLEDALPRVVFSHSTLIEALPKTGGVTTLAMDELTAELSVYPDSNPKGSNDPDALAYIMYTSGSTGRPKGVEVVHRGIVRLLFGVDYVPLNAETTILHMAAVSFDASTFEIWGALLHGGTCVLCPSRVPTLDLIGQLLSEQHVNTFWMTASLFNLVITEAPEILKPVKYLLAGGEALSAWHVEKALRELPGTQLINCYGPTENTTFSTTYTFDRDLFDPEAPIPIGRAIGNSTVYVLNKELQPVPVGTPGELFVGGDGLARGYANRPELTAERFLVDPFSDKLGARMYKTGDMVCWNHEGVIEFIGRVDSQVKLRGFRIELQEIESVLASFPGVEQAIVVAYDDEVRGKWLAGYVKVVDLSSFSIAELEKFAQGKLPDYMVPSTLLTVAEWSYTPSGKLDRKALPKPLLTSYETQEAVPPETETQTALVHIWSEVLQVEQVGIDLGFFKLGGDSLRGVQLLHKIHKRFCLDLPLSILAQHPSIRELAEVIDNGLASAPPSGYRSLQVLQLGNPEAIPLVLIHGGAGNVVVFREFVRNIGKEQPVFAFQWSGWDGSRGHRSLKDMASFYMDELLDHCPSGSYRLGGHCIGGLIAIELAQRLQEKGIGIDGSIIVSDCPNLRSIKYRPFEPALVSATYRSYSRMVQSLCARSGSQASNGFPDSGFMEKVKSIPMVVPLVRMIRVFPNLVRIRLKLEQGSKVPIKLRPLYAANSLVWAAKRHKPRTYSGDILYFRSHCTLGREMGLSGWWDDRFLGFEELCEGQLDGHVVGGGHNEPLGNPSTAQIVRTHFGKLNSKREQGELE